MQNQSIFKPAGFFYIKKTLWTLFMVGVQLPQG